MKLVSEIVGRELAPRDGDTQSGTDLGFSGGRRASKFSH